MKIICLEVGILYLKYTKNKGASCKKWNEEVEQVLEEKRQ